jgi:hypothetical protein
MSSPLIGHQFEVQKILLPNRERCSGLQVWRHSDSSRQQPLMSISAHLPRSALDQYRDSGDETTLFHRKDLKIYDREKKYSENSTLRMRSNG